MPTLFDRLPQTVRLFIVLMGLTVLEGLALWLVIGISLMMESPLVPLFPVIPKYLLVFVITTGLLLWFTDERRIPEIPSNYTLFQLKLAVFIGSWGLLFLLLLCVIPAVAPLILFCSILAVRGTKYTKLFYFAKTFLACFITSFVLVMMSLYQVPESKVGSLIYILGYTIMGTAPNSILTVVGGIVWGLTVSIGAKLVVDSLLENNNVLS